MTRATPMQQNREQKLENINDLLSLTNSAGKEQLTKLTGTSGRWPKDKIIRSGSLDFDMSTGIGGIPRGRITQVYGEYSSGKTTFFLHVVAEAQREGLNVIFIDAESALDPNYCRKLGVDLDLMLINQPDSLQSAMDLMTLAMENSMSDDANDLLIVLDSIPALAPMEVVQASAEQQTRALAARYWSSQLPKITNLARKSRTTILLVNQLRDSMDMYTQASLPGGKAIKFASSMMIKLKRQVEGKNQESGSDGQTVSFNIEKNKMGSPFKKGSFWLPKEAGIDWAQDVINTAIAWGGVIEEDAKIEGGEIVKKKGWYSLKLQEGWFDLINKDELETYMAFNTTPDPETGELPADEDLRKEEDWESEWSDGTEVIQVYRLNAFVAEISPYPSLIEAIEEALLDTLNEGMPIDDIEEVPGTLEEALGE